MKNLNLLPLPAYLADDPLLQALISLAKGCQPSPFDGDLDTFIKAAEQELVDRGTYIFQGFLSSKRRTETICADLGFDDGEPERGGFIYDGSCYIEDASEHLLERGAYYLLIERMDWISNDLAEMEKILFAMHYVHEVGDADTLTLGGEDLDAFIQGYCAANNIGVDGGVFSVSFDHQGKFAPRDAARIIDETARTHDLYIKPNNPEKEF